MLETFYAILSIAAAIAGYAAVGGLTWNLIGELLMKQDDRYERGWEGDDPSPVLGGAFWPIVLPAVFPFLLFSAFKKGKFRIPKLPRRNTKQKALDYAASPVLILSQLVAQRITREPDNLRLGHDHNPIWYWHSSDGRIALKINCVGRSKESPNHVGRLAIDNDVVECDQHVILDAVQKAVNYKLNKDRADAEAARQLKALDKVESLLLAPVPHE